MKIQLVFAATLMLVACFSNETDSSVEHNVTFEHRASKTGGPEKNILIELPSKEVNITESSFYMDVVSVYCGEDICKVDPVRLHWDHLGTYQKYSLLNGVKLEKAHGLDFDEKDYQKLEKILTNKKSGLANLHKNELVRKTPSGNAVDALSGATVAILKDDYVDGAIWTCYTLWHFANGEIVNIIRNISGDSKNEKAFNELLLAGTNSEKIFVIEQLTRRNIQDQVTFDNVLAQASDTSTPVEHKQAIDQAIIQYVDNLPQSLFFSAIDVLFQKNESDLSLLALKSLQTTELSASEDYYGQLSQNLSLSSSYQQINLFLSILSDKQVISPIIIDNIYKLLQHPRFTVQRSTYWFLSEQSVSAEIQQGLKGFYQNHADKL